MVAAYLSGFQVKSVRKTDFYFDFRILKVLYHDAILYINAAIFENLKPHFIPCIKPVNFDYFTRPARGGTTAASCPLWPRPWCHCSSNYDVSSSKSNGAQGLPQERKGLTKPEQKRITSTGIYCPYLHGERNTQHYLCSENVFLCFQMHS